VRHCSNVSTVQEIETAITRLEPGEMRMLADWLVAKLPEIKSSSRLECLRKARGIWKHRQDLPDVRLLRQEFDHR
jgi:hypothetical protein